MLKSLALNLVGAAAIAALAAGDSAASEDDFKLPMKLFGAQDIDGGLSTCRFSFWQANRDPASDRYAYLMHADETPDGARGTGQLKIGNRFYTVHELVAGGEPVGGLASQYLFATNDRDVKVQIELRQVDFRGDAFYIDEAKLTVIQKGKLPFTANAKGLSGCPGSAAGSTDVVDAGPETRPTGSSTSHLPDGIPIGREQPLDDVSEIPGFLRQIARDYASESCDFDGYFAWGGSRHVINDYYLFWQIPCWSGAYQAASVLAVTQNPPQDWGEILTIPNPPSLEGRQNYAAANPQVNGPKGHITTTELSRGVGDCGTFQVIRLIDGPGEVLELELLEYRDKPDCDGNASAPENWPLVYQAN